MEGLILSVIFVVCMLLIVRHIKHSFASGSGCGKGCSGCLSVSESCSPSERKESAAADISYVSVDAILVEQAGKKTR